MSWIQNFFQKFIKDSEDELTNNDLQNANQKSSLPNKINERVKDLETRISYQYPKEIWRDPVVPKTSLEKAVIPTREKRIKKQVEKSIPEQIEIQSVKKEAPKKRIEPISKRTRPFHPTEIPSPIFGYNRPTNKTTIVEHELCQFIEEDFEKQIEISTSMMVQEKTATDLQAEVSESCEVNTRHEVDVAVEDEPISIIEECAQESQNPVFVESEVDKDDHDEVELADEQSNIIEPPREKQTHLPFNVMMLKQDKLKWQESKKKRLEEQKLTYQPKMKSIDKIESAVPENLEPKGVKDLQEDSILYEFPPSTVFSPPVEEVKDTEWLMSQEELLNVTLQNFNVGAKVVNVTQGPSVTRFEVQPEPGVKVNKITNLSDDIKLSLAARDIRIEAPIPGKHTIGIEVPNPKSRPVLINEIIQSSVFQESASPLTAVLGLDISGKPIVTDLKKMPHGLIAGATGSGKSVCINTIIISLLFKASPEDLKLLLIDPKMVELAPYNRIPHLVSPVITDVKAATAALKWAVDEMERRYELFAHAGVRDINRFNELAMQHKRYSDKLPFIVIIIDELADLMMMSPADVEEAICRIAQKARACGIHLIVATQRPSVDVITGLIKANIPTRIAFSVSSQVDSRTIIDISGAEKLLGRGDMLFLENGSSKPLRLQGTFVSDEEIDLVVAHVREQREPDYLFEQEELLKKAQVTEEEDELFYEACEFIIDQGVASTSSLQRRFKIGYNRAARLMDMLEGQGFITSANGSKPREVLITLADLVSSQDAGTI